MQLFLFAFLLFLCALSGSLVHSFPEPLRIQQVTKEGMLLNEGWRFHAGDDPSWAKPDTDDGIWKGINPVTDIHYLPEVKKAGLCWFRLKLQVDSSLLDKPLALVVNQIGASEIYLNGQLLQRFGRASKHAAELRTFNPKGKPIIIHFTGHGQQVLAVRYAIGPKTPYLNYIGFGNPCFSIRLQPAGEAFDHYATPVIVVLTNLLHYGVFLILSVIHLFFYIYYPSRKENLSFSVYTFAFSLALLGDPAFALMNDANTLFIMVTAFFIAVSVSEIFLVLSIYQLYGQGRDIYFKGICLFCLIGVGLALGFYAHGWVSIYVNVMLGALVTIRVSVLAIRRKQRGASIVLGAQLLFLLIFSVFAFYVFYNVPLQENLLFLTTPVYQVSGTIAFLCQPFFISILLATEFGQMNRSLKQQLFEVEKLSRKTIAQEQEKQYILASQKEQLEQQVRERTSVIVAQKEEMEAQRDHLETTLGELQAAQAQLIQQEKAALENELKFERLQKEQAEAAFQSRSAELEMQALRAQMNPHFVFNCLNSINRFILKNESEAASDYLTRFSRLIRLILQNANSGLVPLEKELEALRLYIEMEMLRFENQFSYQISCDAGLEEEELQVPPLIIQPYVENAIWHGLMHKEGKGHLRIELHRENGMLCCRITDDGVGRKRAAELKSKSANRSKSLGMQITAHRLELINALNDKATTVEITDLVDASGQACGTRVLLKIPV